MLPALTGSPKQIAWAEELRAKALLTIRTMVDPTSTPKAPMAYAVLRLYADKITRDETSAKWWIDTRDRSSIDWRNRALTQAAIKCGFGSAVGLTAEQANQIGEWAIRETSMVEIVSAEEATA